MRERNRCGRALALAAARPAEDFRRHGDIVGGAALRIQMLGMFGVRVKLSSDLMLIACVLLLVCVLCSLDACCEPSFNFFFASLRRVDSSGFASASASAMSPLRHLRRRKRDPGHARGGII